MSKELLEQYKAESATGCCQQGKLVFYDESGTVISAEQAKENILAGKPVAIPGAGAGNYSEVFTDLLGFDELEVVDWTSSAGDWSFAVKDETGWRVAWQSNRYPYHGYTYQVAPEGETGWGWGSFEELSEFVCNGC